MAESPGEITIAIEQVQDYEFLVRFGQTGVPDLLVDAPAPAGRGAGPTPARLLAAAVGNCLCESWLFCARKARIEPGPVRATVKVEHVRNKRGRLRIGRLVVTLDPGISSERGAERCLSLFHDYCTVGASVAGGIPVEIEVAGFDRFATTLADAAL